ncbi:MAG: GNAT family N-acetyltransferase [Mycobacteriales bacterium]
MRSANQLKPGRPGPLPVALEQHDISSLSLLSATYARIGAPHSWVSRPAWSPEKWEEWLSRPGLRSWLPRIGGQIAGMVELEAQPKGDVEIVVFGLVPEFVGKGFGGHILTLGTRLAWKLEATDGTPTRRVWLHTSSMDHPHAKPNYEARGFHMFRTEQKQREIPDDTTKTA